MTACEFVERFVELAAQAPVREVIDFVFQQVDDWFWAGMFDEAREAIRWFQEEREEFLGTHTEAFHSLVVAFRWGGEDVPEAVPFAEWYEHVLVKYGMEEKQAAVLSHGLKEPING